MTISRKNNLIIANIFVLNKENKLLILQRSEWKKIPGHEYKPELSHQPDLPGGIVGDNENEKVETGVIRELYEETGIVSAAENLEFLFAKTIFENDRKRSVSRIFFILKIDEIPKIKLSWEHEKYFWANLNETENQFDFFSDMKTEALEYLLNHREIFDV